MAKKSGASADSKSKYIKEYFLNVNPDAKPKEVQQALEKKGIEVKTTLISNVKNQLKKGGATNSKPTRKKKSTTRRTAGVSGDISIEHLFEAKKLVKEVGGIESAMEALQALEKLRSE